MTRPGFSASTIAFSSLATASGSTVPSCLTRIPLSAPMASAVRIVSDAAAGPIDTATISVAWPFSFRRIASSTAISSKGFIAILMLARSTPEPSGLTRTLTLKSITRFTATSSFLHPLRAGSGASYGPTNTESTHVGDRAHVLREQRNLGPAKKNNKNGAGHETADVSPPGGLRVSAEEEIDVLERDPGAEYPP